MPLQPVVGVGRNWSSNRRNVVEATRSRRTVCGSNSYQVLNWHIDQLLQARTANPGTGKADGDAAPVVSRKPYDRSTSYSHHPGQRR